VRLIYGLVDPRTRLVRYVGQSARGLEGTTRRETWIKSLRAIGLDVDAARAAMSTAARKRVARDGYAVRTQGGV